MRAILFKAKAVEGGGYVLFSEDLETGEYECHGAFLSWKDTEQAIENILAFGKPIPPQAA